MNRSAQESIFVFGVLFILNLEARLENLFGELRIRTESDDFLTEGAYQEESAYQEEFGGGYDVFISQLDGDLSGRASQHRLLHAELPPWVMHPLG